MDQRTETQLRQEIAHAWLMVDTYKKAAQAHAWQPIETAPRDGTDVLAYIPDAYNKIDIVSWQSDGAGGKAWCRARCVDGLEAGQPTRWMPLPAPPAAT